MELEVFNKEGCEKDGDQGSARWNCVDGEGSCGTLGFGVKSFRVGLMEAEDVGVGSCVVGQTGAATSRSASGGLLSVMGFAMIILL